MSKKTIENSNRKATWASEYSRATADYKAGIGLTVFLINRPIASKADHQKAKEEAAEKLEQAIARPL